VPSPCLRRASAGKTQIFTNGTKEKIQGDMVVSLPGFNSSIDLCYLFTLGMAHPDPPLSDHFFCKGNGYCVNNRFVEYLKIALRFAGLFLFLLVQGRNKYSIPLNYFETA
jgi:hypothetical protein